LAESDISFSMIRLDSGDLLSLSIQAREILDRAGKTVVKIFASGDLNESLITDLLARGAKIDAFGVGTQLSTSYDKPALGAVYKLVAITEDGKLKMKMKLSGEKSTYPGAKQVWRKMNGEGKYEADVIALEDEGNPEKQGDWQPLLENVMAKGIAREDRLIQEEWIEKDERMALRNMQLQRLNQARRRAAQELQRLPDEVLANTTEARFPVRFSNRLIGEQEKLKSSITHQ
jgi:putative nicotinate phosphoribosyltransferase